LERSVDVRLIAVPQLFTRLTNMADDDLAMMLPKEAAGYLERTAQQSSMSAGLGYTVRLAGQIQVAAISHHQVPALLRRK